MSEKDFESFISDIKSFCSGEFESFADGSFEFELKPDLESESELSNVVAQLEEFIFEEPYERVCEYPREDLKNPCPEDSTFEEFRRDMLMINEHVYKKVISEGTGRVIDMENSKVSYEYAMFTECSPNPFDSSVANKKLGIVCVKDQIEVLPGCHLALETMKLGESAYFLLSSYEMFGKAGCPTINILPYADILFYAKIVKIEVVEAKVEKETESQKSPFKKFIKEASKQYKAAHDLCSHGDFQGAVEIYRKWIDKVEDFRISTDEDEARKKELLVKMYQNLSICYNKINQPEKTCLMLRELERLTSIKNNPKALFAKAKAAMLLDNFKWAREYFNKVKAIAPDDPNVDKALEELNTREQEKLDFYINRNNLEVKLRKEIQSVEELDKQTAEGQCKQDDALQAVIKVFKDELIKIIEEFNRDDSLENLSLSLELPTAEHIHLAHHLCKQYGIILKGIQKIDSDGFDYHLSKQSV